MQVNSQTLLIVIIIFAFFSFIIGIISVLALVKINNLKKQLSLLFSGKKASDLESLIMSHANELKLLDTEIQQLFEISNKVHNLALQGIHKVNILRFNPFNDIGGDQSFAIALLNGKNSGLVISSLHTREGTRIYAKPIKKGECEKYTLTEEEKKVIFNAVTKKPKKLQ